MKLKATPPYPSPSKLPRLRVRGGTVSRVQGSYNPCVVLETGVRRDGDIRQFVLRIQNAMNSMGI